MLVFYISHDFSPIHKYKNINRKGRLFFPLSSEQMFHVLMPFALQTLRVKPPPPPPPSLPFSPFLAARKPFQCRYCPYSASQKGNLKTHVLCVHRKPFDNSQYPDRRLRRSHMPPRPPRLPASITGDNHASARDQIGMTSLCGS